MVATFLFATSGKKSPGYHIEIHSPDYAANEWIDSDTDKPVSSRVLLVHHEETINIEKTVTENLGQGICIGFWNYFLNIRLYVDDVLLFDAGLKEEPSFGKELGGVWHLIPLPDDMTGKKIRISIYNPTMVKQFFMDTITIGSPNEINFSIFRSTNISMAITVIIVVIIILMLLYIIILRYYNLHEYIKTFVFLLMLSLDAGIYVYTDTAVFQYILYNPVIQYLLRYFSIFCIPIFLLLFFRQFYYEERIIFTCILNVYGVVLLINLLLYIFNIVHLSRSIYIIHVCTFIIMLAIFVTAIYKYIKNKDAVNLWVLIAVLVLSVGSTLSITGSYYLNNYDTSRGFRITFVLFIALIFATMVRLSLRRLSSVTIAERYKTIAYTDSSTGGKSLVWFQEQLPLLEKTGYYFIIINPLKFKLINTLIGRKQSDLLLKDLYRCLETLVAKGELLVSLGNAKFGMCIKAEDLWQIHVRCCQIKEMVDEYQKKKQQNFSLTLQFCASKYSDEISLETLIDNALMSCENPYAKYFPDINLFIYNEECTRQLLNAKLLEDHLSDAIANDEFLLYLQPKVSLVTGKVAGAEALVRWQFSGKGLIPPDDFIPLFEQDGRIGELDIHMFEKVCIMIARWLAAGVEPPVISVNISKQAINFEGYFNLYLEIIRNYNIPGKYLQFELTESIAYNNIELLRDIFNSIHSLGATCAMDDFGKSYSNITALGALKFDSAKMDKCFFEDGFPSDEKKTSLAAGAINLLHSLKLKVIAEGIEDEAQVNSLKELGCDEIQGFFYSRPLPEELFARYCGVLF